MKFNFEINKNLNNLLLQLVVLIQFKIKENLTKEELRHPSNIFTVCWDPAFVPPRVTALHHVADSDSVMGGFVRPHGGTKTSKGRDRKIMFLWWAGLPKV